MYIILGLVGKNWLIFHVSPLWNLNFDTSHLNLLTKQLNKFLTKHISTNLKSQKNYFSQIAVNIETKEAHHECIAVKVIKYISIVYYSDKYISIFILLI